MKRIFLLSLFVVLFGNLAIFAQTSVFNAPSTDVIAKNSLYSEVVFSSHFDKPEKGGFRSYGYRMVYGLRKNVEVGGNFYYTRSGDFSLKEIQANAKWKVFNDEKRGISVVTGVMFCLPLKNTAGLKPSSMIYSNVSKTISSTKKTRLTGGYYGMIGPKSNIPSKNGIIAGVEQPISKRIAIVADWYSGKNRFSYSFAGFRAYLTKKQVLTAGYNFGNIGRANNSFSISYGIYY